MEIITTNPDIKWHHCFLRFNLSQSALNSASYQSSEHALAQVLDLFNNKMRVQLSDKATSTPGKIMHSKVFQQQYGQNTICQIRCYFALSGYQEIDWQAFLTRNLPPDVLDGRCKFTKLTPSS